MDQHVKAAQEFIKAIPEACKGCPACGSECKCCEDCTCKFVPLAEFFNAAKFQVPQQAGQALERIKSNGKAFCCNYAIIFGIFQLLGLLIKPPIILLLGFSLGLIWWSLVVYQIFKKDSHLVKDAIAFVGLVTLSLFWFSWYHRDYVRGLIFLEFWPLVICLGHMIITQTEPAEKEDKED